MTWFLAALPQILSYAVAHLWLSIPPIVLGFLISIPIGWGVNRLSRGRRWAGTLAGFILALAGILYAIPSLPLFEVLPSIIGSRVLDPINVEVALTLYALALMVRTTADALASVDADVRLSANAVGYNGWQRFWAVEFPLAGPVLLAGLRVVSVSTVSLVTIGSVIGVNSLGFFFLDGYQRSFPTEIVVGILGTVIIALIFDVLLVLLGRWLMPWTRIRSRNQDGAALSGAKAVGAL